jgi:disulfide bond formation protein DsbB
MIQADVWSSQFGAFIGAFFACITVQSLPEKNCANYSSEINFSSRNCGKIYGIKMLNKITPRAWYIFVVFCCASLMGFALYNQYVDYLDPCPLCVFQRLVFIWMGAFALLAVIHNPGKTGLRIYAWLVALGAILGASIAGRHIWLQSLPADEVPECGPGLNYMLDNFPLTEVLASVLRGSGSCAEVIWSFMGMSMPMWTMFWYTGLGLITLWVVYRPGRH